MDQGWIKLHRALIEKPIWRCSTQEQKVILITLMLMANHKANEWEWNGQKYTLQPGEFITSLKSIAEKAGPGISIRNVRTAIEKLEKYEFLTNKSTNKNRLITIVNWDFYQTRNDEVTSRLTSDRQASDKRPTTNKNVKNDKNKYIDHFDTFWNSYPKKVGKAAAQKSFEKIKVDDNLLQFMLSTIEIQKQSNQWSNKQFIPNPATWLNQRRWEDEIESVNSTEGITLTADGTFKI